MKTVASVRYEEFFMVERPDNDYFFREVFQIAHKIEKICVVKQVGVLMENNEFCPDYTRNTQTLHGEIQVRLVNLSCKFE